MNPANPVLQRLGVLPAERSLFGWAGLCLFAMGAAAFALLNTAETLFLKRVGVDALPLALLASSGLLVVTTALIGRFVHHEPAVWLPRVLVGLALAILPFVLLVGSELPLVFGALVLVSRQVLALGLLAFWLTMGSLVPGRRAKQLFAPLASGVTLGGILGSFGSEPMARLVGVGGLIALCSLLLFAAAFLAARLGHHGSPQLAGAFAPSAPAGGPLESGFAQLSRTSQLFRLLAVSTLCAGSLSPVLYFQFSSVLDSVTQGPGGEEQLLGLYSQFRGWLNVAMLGTQLWLSTTLYRRIGLPLSLALLPAAYVLGFGWIAVHFALVAAFGGYGASRVAEDGIGDSAMRVLPHLFPDRLRARAAGLLSGPINRIGGVLGNSFVLLALALGAAAWIGWLAIPVAGLWFASTLVLWRAYPRLLLQASAEHGLAGAGVDREMLLDSATFKRLAASLLDPDPRVCRAALDLLADGEPSEVVGVLAEAIEQAPPASRPAIVETLHRLVEPWAPGSIRSERAVHCLAGALRARPPLPPEERADLLRVYARLSGGENAPEELERDSRALIDRALGDRAAPVRLVAIAELDRRGAPPPGLPDLDRTLADALAASDALVRRAARKELRAILLATPPDEHWRSLLQILARQLEQRADRAETAEALREIARHHGGHVRSVAAAALGYAEDRDPRVRGALLSMAGHAGVAEHGPQLVASLAARAPEEAQGAREGLVALGVEAAVPLLVGRDFGSPARREAIVSVLRELEVDAETLDSLGERQLDSIREAIVQRAALDASTGGIPSLLVRRLDERILEGLCAALDLLAARHHDSRLAELERRLRRSPDARDRDLLVEAIEAVVRRTPGAAIVPLLDASDWGARAEAAAAALGRPRPQGSEALEQLRGSADATTAALAAEIPLEAAAAQTAAIPLEAAAAIGDAPRVPASMDIAVRLQGLPAFDRLSTQQLLAVAELLQEQKIGEGERIYAAGEEGLGIYFVWEGEVELRRGDLILGRVDPGAFFGELSSLDGVPRSADAVATTGTRVLRLDRNDLFSLLEEVPGLAVGFAQFLAARVRRLEDRLEDASSPSGEDG